MSFLSNLRIRIPAEVYHDLFKLGKKYSERTVYREKGIDVALACKMVELGMNDAYDIAYLLSGDGDYCPAVQMVQGLGKRVFAANPAIGIRLQARCDVSIRLKPDWFSGCYV